MLHIASSADAPRITTGEISERRRIPRVFLTKIIGRLVHAGLLASQRGAHGGLTLAKPIHEIKLLEIVEAIDGPIRRTPCFIRPDECICNRRCPIYDSWNAMQNSFAESLEKHTLDSIVCGKEPVHE
jgi:Rrf2 family protein